MKIERMITIDNPDHFLMGDRIHVDHYTATCQKITRRGALFFLDQYLDDRMRMNARKTNRGGYEKSGLRKALQSDKVLDIFKDIRDDMVPFENGDLLRIPFAGELFGDKLPSWCERDGHKQWPLMTDAHNRTASRCGDLEWGWLANTFRDTSTNFCVVACYGAATAWSASSVLGVRPAFLIRQDEEGKKIIGSEKVENVS